MFACLSNLKQSCSKFYKEQTLFRSQVMKMYTTCSKMAHKSELKADPTLRKISKSCNEIQFSCTPVYSSVVYKQSQTSSSSNCKSCSSHVDVQLCQLHLELYHHGLGDNHRQTSLVSRLMDHWIRVSGKLQWWPFLENARCVAPHGGEGLNGRVTVAIWNFDSVLHGDDWQRHFYDL